MKNIQSFIEYKAYLMRYWSIIMTTEAESGHVTSALSAADIVATLFFHVMKYNPEHYNDPRNDRFILSKGHAVPIVYAAWKEVGVLNENDLLGYRKFDSLLEGHPTPRFAYNEAATGSLGMGLSIGVGEALAARLSGYQYRTYVLMGDSEVAEGSVWEAIELASYNKLNNLCGIIDCNKLGQSTQTMDGYDTDRYAAKIKAFGWHPIICNGHNVAELLEAFKQATQVVDRPTMVIARTIKGYGVKSVEGKQGFHGKPFSKKELVTVLTELKNHFADATNYKEKEEWKPPLPDESLQQLRLSKEKISVAIPHYAVTEKIATRFAYGQALVSLGAHDELVVSLDGEVKNSTYAELFADKFPDRFIQSFIAEQNMVGMAIGLSKRGYKPFVSTFGVFFTRAYDQIRMASIGDACIKFCGSHAGVSIGQDGPSQMALEDISMFNTIDNSNILYPSDAISTWRLMEQMVNFDQGISYLRTTRAATPLLYNAQEDFPIPGMKRLKHDVRDKVCIVAAGITLFEALKAYDILVLAQDQLFVTIIDLYCIKPLNVPQLIEYASQADYKLLTVEDHYFEGGIGQIISAALCNSSIIVESLAVRKKPRSGTPEELLNFEGIDAHSIELKVRAMVKNI